MDRPSIDDLWTRLLDRQPLSSQEHSDLRDQFVGHPELRNRLLDDLCIDNLLRCAATEPDVDGFVESLAQRLDAAGAEVAPPVRSNGNALVEPPVAAPPIHQASFIAAPPVAVIPRGQPLTPRRPIRRWLPFALAGTVVLMAGTVAVLVARRERGDQGLARQPSESLEARPGASESQVRPRPGAAGPLSKELPDDVRNTTPHRQPPAESPGSPPTLPEGPNVKPQGEGDGSLPSSPALPSRLVATLPPHESSPSRPVDPPSSAGAPIIARITDAKSAVWYANGPKRHELTAGDLRLSEGRLQITMDRGAVVTLTAPAELELHTPQRVVLRRGDLTATVPSQAVGFEVKTSCSRVIDLGTEFDVSVDDAGSTGVRVSRGKVEVSTTPSTGAGQRWQLDAGQSKWISSDAKRHLDYRLALTKARPEKAVGGTLTINGERMDFSRPEEFARVWVRLGQELLKLQGLAPSRADGSFRGEVDLNGKRLPIASAADAVRANQEAVSLFGKLWADALRGTSGGEMRIENLEDLLKSQNELFNRFFDGAVPRPEARPKPPTNTKGDS